MIAIDGNWNRFLLAGNQGTVFAGVLLHQNESISRAAELQGREDVLDDLIGNDGPETGDSPWLAFDTSPEKPHGGRVFRAEEFESPLTDDSNKGL